MLYQPGETVVAIGDIFPAVIEPYPPELPTQRDGTPQTGLLFRVLITERGLAIGWQAGGMIQRVDIPLTPEQTEGATFRGGLVGPYEVRMTGACRCKARMLSSWDKSQIFPGAFWSQRDTLEKARVDAVRDSRYGLPSNRDTPVRYTRI
jgi:hypothetical protein